MQPTQQKDELPPSLSQVQIELLQRIQQGFDGTAQKHLDEFAGIVIQQMTTLTTQVAGQQSQLDRLEAVLKQHEAMHVQEKHRIDANSTGEP
jgi:hypothetical protein